MKTIEERFDKYVDAKPGADKISVSLEYTCKDGGEDKEFRELTFWNENRLWFSVDNADEIKLLLEVFSDVIERDFTNIDRKSCDLGTELFNAHIQAKKIVGEHLGQHTTCICPDGDCVC